MSDKREVATLGGGCFWCLEAVFEQVRGVERVKSGYAGGHVKNPSYREVCTGKTGHAEVVQVEFDPDVISYREILEVFFATHDPTQLNRQGPDVGTQYRSGIYYTNDEPAAVSVLEPIFEQDAPIFVSTITVMELFSYPALTDEEEARLNRVLSTTRIEPFSVGIARLAGDLRRLYPSLKPLDSGIAATSLYMNSTLATRNVRDFQRIEELSLLEI